MISFLYFDLGNVILNFDHQIACQNLAKLTAKSPDDIRRVVFDGDLERGVERGEISDLEFYERFCSELKVSPSRADVELAASDIFSLNTPMIALIASVHDAGYRTGILSNTCDAHWKFAHNKYRVLRSCFEVYALSYRLKLAKPEAKIYADAAELAGVPPEEIFFVDDKSENVAAAKEAGFQAVVFEDAHHLARQLRQLGVVFNY